MSEENQTERLVIPAEADEVARFPAGTKIRGTIGGVGGDSKTAIFVADSDLQMEALLLGGIGLPDDFAIGDQGHAIMEIDEQTETSHWRFEKDE